MKIAIIGAGNVGGALAKRWADAGHTIFLGMRNPDSKAAKELINFNGNISSDTISNAIDKSEVVLFSTPPDVAVKIAKDIPLLKNKIIIDATNSVFVQPEPYKTAFDGIKKETSNDKVVKCFNTTGFENMVDPKYGNESADMFVASSNIEAKNIVIKLAEEVGFAKCYDFGGDEKVELLEQFALSWINLAVIQKNGRNIAFKIISK